MIAQTQVKGAYQFWKQGLRLSDSREAWIQQNIVLSACREGLGDLGLEFEASRRLRKAASDVQRDLGLPVKTRVLDGRIQ